ncbi:MAG: NADH-quinone oxidoreductase subunit NuoB [Clostridia bacterium]|jgi:Ni,Fe-hydrogenase III small subunit/ferredoxin|nr:NADH-quinone oxidoreductase subunit NuoB [Clostridia bacterium]
MFSMLKKIIKYRSQTLKYPKEPLDTTFVWGRPEISSSACTLCRKCIEGCPTQAITVNAQNEAGINLDECIFCYTCAEICPAAAITVSKHFELAAVDRSDLRHTALSVEDEALRIIAKKIDEKAKKRLGRSLQIREVDAGSCNGCDYEINGLNNPFNDLERFGIHFVASPRHADMLLVTGPVTRNMETALLRTYEAAPDPKLVVAVGACACSGGIFKDGYACKGGVDQTLPVDAYIPGCPPRPQAILYGILKALERT